MHRWAWRLAFGFGIAGGIVVALNELFPVTVHLSFLQEWVGRTWEEKIRRVSSLLYEYRENPSAWQAHTDVLFLRYSLGGYLIEWNTARWPLPQAVPGLSSLTPELVGDERSLYYALKLFADTSVQVAFIPILIQPSHAGVYKHQAWVGRLQELCINRNGEGLPLLLRDLEGRSLLRLYVGCPEALRFPLRWVYVFLFGVSLVSFLVGGWMRLRQRFSPVRARLIFLFLLVGVWQVLHWTGLPGRLLPSDISFFSAERCAISPFHTSIWDVAWTLGILVWAASSLGQRSLSSGWKALLVYIVGFWGVWLFFGGGLFLFIRHSQVEIDPVRQPNWMELLGWASILWIIWRLQEYLGSAVCPRPWMVFLVGAGVGIPPMVYIGLPWWSILSLVILYFTSAIRWKIPLFLVHAVQSILLAVSLNGWITWGYERKANLILETHAPQVAQLRDPALEYRVAQILPRLSVDTALWYRLEVTDYLIDAGFIAKMIQKYFLSLSEKYEVVVSCWSPDGRRLDNLFETRPLPRRQVLPPRGSATLAPHLYFLTQDWPRYIYVASLPVQLPSLPPIEVQIEFYPRTYPLRSRLYPMEEEEVPPVSYALYQEGRLLRKWGAEPFPSYISNRPLAGTSRRHTERYYEYTFTTANALTAYLRYPARDKASHLATIPLLLFLLSMVLLIQNYSQINHFVKTLYRREGPLATQLQALFWALVALPLFGLVAVTFFLFLRLSQERLRQELSQRLTAVSGYLSGDPILPEKLSYWIRSYMASEESFVRDLMHRVARLSGSEVFLYTTEGHLYSSTLSRAHWGIYASPLLEPGLLRQLRRMPAEALIEVEEGGERLLGYIPLHAKGGGLIGILHIPMPVPKKSFYDQLRNFIGYAVNVYLFLILSSILLGMILIRRFSNGLQRVVQQLRLAPEEPDPPTLRWEGQGDEIATLVSAYNDMAERLRANQKQLEATLRRVSQQEMAFQAAHEIKTALTPLKIHLQHLQRMPTVEPEKLRDISTRLLQRIEALVRIANTFMSFARLGSSEALPLSPLHLSHFLEEYLHPYRQNPHLPVELRLPAEPIWIQANSDALQQVLNNLLQNALQALEGHAAPRIVVSLALRGEEAILSIQDNGPGIPSEVRERIFEFYFTTRRTGTGLGLAITKGLVERMGGRISFVSEVGMGTTFYVVFPAYTG
ncbi:MAG: HAMP domain-containing histidine kinase [Bacteroidia bacterium]|nr:HAMP domain-containing histidine kinase [Bacteroidia bacterium]